MATKYWVGSDTSWNTSGNWSAASGGAGGAGVPGPGDDVIFDGSNSQKCICDVAIDIASMDIQDAGDANGAYGGVFSFSSSSYSHSISGNCRWAGTGSIAAGNNTITIGGDWDYASMASTGSTSTIILSKSGTSTVTSSHLKVYNNITVNSGCTADFSSTARFSGTITINGEWASPATNNPYQPDGGTINVGSTGTLSGAGATAYLIGSTVSVAPGGTWSIGNTSFRGAGTINAGTYGGTWTLRNQSTSESLTIGNSATFTGNVTFDAGASGTYTIDNSGNYTLTFQGDVTFTETVGTLAITEGTGTFLMSGTGNQTFTNTASLDSIGTFQIDKTAGKVSLAASSPLTCSVFDFDDGDFDPNGQTITTSSHCDWAGGTTFVPGDADTMNSCTWTIGGNFTCDGQDLNATAGWDLDVTGTAVASGTGNVEYCTAGGTEIDASAGPWTDGDNNTNWNFESGLNSGQRSGVRGRYLRPLST